MALPRTAARSLVAALALFATTLATVTPAPAAPLPAPDDFDDLTALVLAMETGIRDDDLASTRDGLREAWTLIEGLDDEQLAHPDFRRQFWQIGTICEVARELDVGTKVWRLIVDQHAATVPETDPQFLQARGVLAIMSFQSGDVFGAAAEFEAVYEIRKRTLPADSPQLQQARNNLAIATQATGDVARAAELMEATYRANLALLRPDHPEVLKTRGNLAGMKAMLGDYRGALLLFEQVVAEQTRALDDTHPDLQISRNNLADVRKHLGDYQGALAVERKILEVAEATLPEGHPDRCGAQVSMARTLRFLDRDEQALELCATAVDQLAAAHGDDHPALLDARTLLAVCLVDVGQDERAVALLEEVDARATARWPERHPRRRIARSHLALAVALRGELDRAIELSTEAVATLEAALPAHHVDVQRERHNLLWLLLDAGRAGPAEDLARRTADSARARLSDWSFSPRAAGLTARIDDSTVNALFALARGYGDVEPRPDVLADALLVSQTLRGVEMRAARRTRHALASGGSDARRLELELTAVTSEVVRLATAASSAAAPEGGELAELRDALAAAVGEKERLQRELIRLAAADGWIDPAEVTVEDLAAALPPRSAAAAVVGFDRAQPHPERRGPRDIRRELALLVVGRDAQVALHPLGPEDALAGLVQELRTPLLGGTLRGEPLGGPRRPDAAGSAADVELRRRVLDPLRALAGDVDTVYLSVDETLELVPLDALPDDDGRPVGDRLALRPVVSLLDLLEPPSAGADRAPDGRGPPMLLALGGPDYLGAPRDVLASHGGAAAPVLDPLRSAGPAFTELPGTRDEVEVIRLFFDMAHEDGEALLLTDDEASKAALVRHAPDATYLHLATHGFFAPASATTVEGLSPLVLTGLALAGANRPPDELGHASGILTAEELLAVDLSDCELVVLSACETSLGVERAGQGHASLKAALLGAGARFVVTSLWKVGDDETARLMTDFYRALWVDGDDPRTALWKARTRARERGAPFRDWAGWVLTGV